MMATQEEIDAAFQAISPQAEIDRALAMPASAPSPAPSRTPAQAAAIANLTTPVSAIPEGLLKKYGAPALKAAVQTLSKFTGVDRAAEVAAAAPGAAANLIGAQPTPVLNKAQMDKIEADKAAAVKAAEPGNQLALTMPTQVGPQGSPLVNHPFGWTPGAGGIMPETEKEILAGPGREAAAGEKVARVQAQTATVISDMMGQAADQSEQHIAHRAVMQAERDAQVDAAIKQRADLSAKQAEMNPDGSRFWRNPSSIMMAIGAVLTPGGKGMDRLDAAIQRDLDLQKTAFDQQGEKAKAQDTLIAQYDKVFADRNQRDKAAQADAYENAARRMVAFAERSKAPELMAQAEVNSARLMQHAASLRGQLNQLDFHRAWTSGGTGGVAAKGLNTVRLPNGKTVSFQTPKDRELVQEKLNAAMQLAHINSRAQELRAKMTPGFRLAHPIEAHKIDGELDSLAERALPAWSTANGQGQVKEEEAKRYKKNLFPYTKYLDPAADKIIEAGVRSNEQTIDDIVKSHNGEYVDTGYAQTPSGGLQPVAAFRGDSAKPGPTSMPPGFRPQ